MGSHSIVDDEKFWTLRSMSTITLDEQGDWKIVLMHDNYYILHSKCDRYLRSRAVIGCTCGNFFSDAKLTPVDDVILKKFIILNPHIRKS